MTARLFELTSEMERLAELLDQGDDSPELTAALATVSEQLEAKAAGVGAVLATLEAEAEMYTAEITRLAAKKKRALAAAESLSRYVHMSLESRGILRLKGGTFEFRVQQNPESVVVTDESLVPDECKRSVTTVSVDKRLVLELARKHGECCPGAQVVRTTRLVVR